MEITILVHNDEVTVYAKENPITKEAEKDTVEFYRNDMPVLEKRDDFRPGDIDKITIFIWLEGDDPECVDNLLGGEIKIHMEITEEHKEDSRIERNYEDNNDNNETVHADVDNGE